VLALEHRRPGDRRRSGADHRARAASPAREAER
jgi:hypothetical protein